MSTQKKSISKLCLTGFILAIITPLVSFGSTALSLLNNALIYVLGTLVAVLLPIVGFILSIIGVCTARKAGKSGKGLGIAGIVLPVVYVVVLIAVFGYSTYRMVDLYRQEQQEIQQNELYEMDGVHLYKNTEYDISQYRLMEGYEAGAASTAADLTAFADRLQNISRESDIRIRGTYQDHEFIIIRRDSFDEWLSDCTGTLTYTEEGYATIEYFAEWEHATFRDHTLDIYTDPDGQFIIITNCDDYKVISEFFG